MFDFEKVEFEIDNIVTHTSYLPPYFWTWNTRMYSNGPHELLVTAYDVDGNFWSYYLYINTHSLKIGG